MKKIISFFALISLTFSLICCKDSSSSTSSNTDSPSKSSNTKKGKADPKKKYPSLSFDVMYVGINELKKHPRIIFQLKNMKEGSKDDSSKRHEYVLIGYYSSGKTFTSANDLIKNDSIHGAGIHPDPIPQEDPDGGIDLKTGNYQYQYNPGCFPAEAAYMILTPSNSGYSFYIQYKVSFYDSKLIPVPTPICAQADALTLDPSPPAIPPF